MSAEKTNKTKSQKAITVKRAKTTKLPNLEIVANEPATVETLNNAPAKPTGVLKKPKKSKAETESVEPKEKKLSALDAAAQVLAKSDKPMNCQELIETMGAKKLWSSPGGKTPHATLYAAMLREITTKGKEARFKKVERGQFAASK